MNLLPSHSASHPSISKSSLFHLHNTPRIHPPLTASPATTLVQTAIISLLDSFQSLLSGCLHSTLDSQHCSRGSMLKCRSHHVTLLILLRINVMSFQQPVSSLYHSYFLLQPHPSPPCLLPALSTHFLAALEHMRYVLLQISTPLASVSPLLKHHLLNEALLFKTALPPCPLSLPQCSHSTCHPCHLLLSTDILSSLPFICCLECKPQEGKT